MKVIAREFMSRQAGNEVLLRHHSLILQKLPRGKSNLTSFSNLLLNPNMKDKGGHAF